MLDANLQIDINRNLKQELIIVFDLNHISRRTINLHI